MARPLTPPPPAPRRRASRRRRPRGLRLLALALGVGLFAELILALFASPRFAVTRIEVLGARRVPNALIIAQAAIPDGANIFRLPRRPVERRVAALPALRAASLRRHLPHTIAIEVVERQPVLFVQDAGRRTYLDRGAVCFQLCGDDAPAVQLLGVSPRRCTPGRRARDPRIAPALQVVAAARRAGLAPARCAFSPGGEMDLLLADGTTLRLGEADRLAAKLHKARLALDALSGRGPIEYLDVSCPEAIVWKPAEPSPRQNAQEPDQGPRAAL